jgi:hypothetical protein
LTVANAMPPAPSEMRTTLPDGPRRCALMNAMTSAALTSNGSLSTTLKKTLKSYAAARSVFRRARARTNSKYSSMTG